MRTMLSVFLFGLIQSAGLSAAVEFKGTPQMVDVSGTPMQVYPQAALTTPTGVTPLKLTGFGIRQKSVAFINVNVYFATSYADESLSLNPESPIDSLKDAKGRVILLDMLRTMTAQDIRAAFEEALDVNGVNVNSKEIQSLLSRFQGDLYAGNRIVISSHPGENGLENLVVELPKSNLSEAGNLLGLDFWKIWFGEPVDALMGELKTRLVGVKKP